MSSPESEEGGVLREWAPLSRFLQQVPQKMWRGIFLENVIFTCLDADVDSIAIGTSVGVVFWYHRSTHIVHQLKPEKCRQAISSVCITSSVEFMVAAGDRNGVVTIFRIPKDVPECFTYQKLERIERYTVDELHSNEITALAWSINGQKLFSGDAKGGVVLTDIDFCMSITKAYEILNEKYKIVQLCYNQREQVLVVATELRSVICHNSKSHWKIVQIGQRERHNLIELGATFCIENNIVSIYSCRGGLRLWKSDLEGNVKHTVIFKDIVNSSLNPVKLLRPIKKKNKLKNKTYELGKINYWKDGLYVTYYENNFIVLDPESATIAATIMDAECNFTSVTTTKMEVFLIYGDRNLIRLAYTPDKYNSSIGGYGNLASAEPVSGLPNFYLNPVVGIPISNVNNIPPRVKLTAATANTELPASEVTYGTESTVLLHPAAANRDGVPEVRLDGSRYHLFSAIGKQEFDEIVYNKYKKKKQKSKTKAGHSGNSKKFISQLSYTNSVGLMEGQSTTEQNNLGILPTDLRPDPKAFQGIAKDFKNKDSILDAIFASFVDNSLLEQKNNKLHFCKDESSKQPNDELNEKRSEQLNEPQTNNIVQSSSSSSDSASSCILNLEHKSVLEHFESNLKTKETSSLIDEVNSSTEQESPLIATNAELTFPSAKKENALMEDNCNVMCDYKIDLNEEITDSDSVTNSKCDDVAIISTTVEYNNIDSLSCSQISETDSFQPEDDAMFHPTTFRELVEGWTEMSCPEKVIWLSVNSSGIIMCSPRLRAFVFKDENWCKLPFKAQSLAVTFNGELAVRNYCSLAHYTKHWPSKDEWKLLSHGVDWVSLTEDNQIWFIYKGEIHFLSNNSDTVDRLHCNTQFLRVYASVNGIFGISKENEMFLYDNENWTKVRIPKVGAKYLAFGPKRLNWLINVANQLFVTDCLTKEKTIWWKVDIRGKEPFEVASIATSEDGLYISNGQSPSIFFNKTSVIGHRWEKSEIDVKCIQLTAESVFEDKGCLWLLCTPNQLLTVTPCLTDFELIDVPCNVVCLASSPQVLWLLSDEGEIFVRQGINFNNPAGSKWVKLNLEQFDRITQFAHISCGCDVVWACDIRGVIFMLVGSPHEIPTYNFSPAWVKVEGRANYANTFTKVFVGPQSHMVWALDNTGNVYVREAIFPDFLVGTGWVHVPGIIASQLSISTEAVIALTKEGVYKRLGVSQNNYIGDSWELTPVQLEHLSVSVNEGMYGVSSESNILMSYVEKIFPISEEVFVEKDWTLL